MEPLIEETSSQTSDMSSEPSSPMVEDLQCPMYWPVGFKNTFKLVQRIITGEVQNDEMAARSLHSLVRKQLSNAARENYRETAALLWPETGEQANFELLVETVLLRQLAEGAADDTVAREELAVLVENWAALPGIQEETERFLRYLRPRIWKDIL
ncbi:hypothetical protein M406DRAFT_68813 [Cryphonectria parasitica EP155]|uniref:Uncharacterized protein n=1 Tax=Cryphonectria parasitica (strain ATCC 38755 / EP155) TaxID=660469 RepID=A0A9P4Y515_CRYP1|nr:uncharacterized protein M406DRAFT_68813 [Cryphonectria parasitica EP155]KAF3766482.1 hypothetical protein M406DRAFT_68813 [Cryphonectria parasitica EP155]